MCRLAEVELDERGARSGDSREVQVQVLVSVDGADGDVTGLDVVLAGALVGRARPAGLVVTEGTLGEPVVLPSLVEIAEVSQRHRERGRFPVDAVGAVHFLIS